MSLRHRKGDFHFGRISLESTATAPIFKQLKEVIILFSALSFLFYGTGCFTSLYLRAEFERYGFSAQRRLIGFLQICGSLALIIGNWLPILGKAGALGLALMMFAGVIVRIKIRDTFFQTTPAIFYCLLNTYLVFFAY